MTPLSAGHFTCTCSPAPVKCTSEAGAALWVGVWGLSDRAGTGAGRHADGQTAVPSQGWWSVRSSRRRCSVNSGHLCRQQAVPRQQRLLPEAAGDTSPPRWMAEPEAGSLRKCLRSFFRLSRGSPGLPSRCLLCLMFPEMLCKAVHGRREGGTGLRNLPSWDRS